MGKTLAELFTKLVESPVTLVIFAGLVIFVLGVSGGIPYKDMLTIAPGIPQISAIGIGVLLLAAGVILIVYKPSSPRPYGITITYPIQNEALTDDSTEVRGKMRKIPPKGTELWLLRLYDSGFFVPVRHVELTPGKEEWAVADFTIGRSRGERTIIAALAGQPAQYLFSYFKDAAGLHNGWMDELGVGIERKNRYLPSLDRKQFESMGIVECDRVVVRAV